MSLTVICPLAPLSILWKAAYGSKVVNLHKFCLLNSIFISVSPVNMSSLANFLIYYDIFSFF